MTQYTAKIRKYQDIIQHNMKELSKYAPQNRHESRSSDFIHCASSDWLRDSFTLSEASNMAQTEFKSDHRKEMNNYVASREYDHDRFPSFHHGRNSLQSMETKTASYDSRRVSHAPKYSTPKDKHIKQNPNKQKNHQTKHKRKNSKPKATHDSDEKECKEDMMQQPQSSFISSKNFKRQVSNSGKRVSFDLDSSLHYMEHEIKDKYSPQSHKISTSGIDGIAHAPLSKYRLTQEHMQNIEIPKHSFERSSTGAESTTTDMSLSTLINAMQTHVERPTLHAAEPQHVVIHEKSTNKQRSRKRDTTREDDNPNYKFIDL